MRRVVTWMCTGAMLAAACGPAAEDELTSAPDEATSADGTTEELGESEDLATVEQGLGATCGEIHNNIPSHCKRFFSCGGGRFRICMEPVTLGYIYWLRNRSTRKRVLKLNFPWPVPDTGCKTVYPGKLIGWSRSTATGGGKVSSVVGCD